MTITMLLETGIRATGLTGLANGRRLGHMTNREPTAFGLNSTQLAEIAKRATSEASKANLRAGIPVTGMVDGRIRTRYPSEVHIADSRQGSRDVFVE